MQSLKKKSVSLDIIVGASPVYEDWDASIHVEIQIVHPPIDIDCDSEIYYDSNSFALHISEIWFLEIVQPWAIYF